MLVLCEAINHLRVPFLLGLVCHDESEQTGLAIHRIKGITLEDFIAAPNEHTQAVRVGIFAEVVRTLAVLHRHRMLHNDPKADNIIISEGHLPYIIDSGNAELRSSTASIEDGQVQDVTCLFALLRGLSPDVHQSSRRPGASTTSVPPCIGTAHGKLKRFFDDRDANVVTAAELQRLLAECNCGQHVAPTPAPAIQQDHKLKLATVANMCSQDYLSAVLEGVDERTPIAARGCCNTNKCSSQNRQDDAVLCCRCAKLSVLQNRIVSY